MKPARTVKTTDEIKQAVVYRDAGYSLASIAAKTSISPSTLKRHFSKLGTSKGALTSQAVNDARLELLNDGGFISDLKQQIASSLLDDLQQSKDLRESIAVCLSELMNDANATAAMKARSLASLSTSLVLSQKMMRLTLLIDKQEVEQSELPNLFISELTGDDIEVMR
ncbi:hypothetical protein [Methylobacter sp. S3L5C]|uniref:hypothetical protein n=1 Tax=Methylobacter sp. S3L5C TaxID=2839024 RepID=UPI001FAD174E|nr:hypothetical protein [Methylobacter sp. S3L5C]UOA08122.1 hypothetical protein KKZ03_18160 [Methylobacter sp. S3L5C]